MDTAIRGKTEFDGQAIIYWNKAGTFVFAYIEDIIYDTDYFRIYGYTNDEEIQANRLISADHMDQNLVCLYDAREQAAGREIVYCEDFRLWLEDAMAAADDL